MRKSAIAIPVALAMVSVVVPVSSEPIAYGHNWGRDGYDVASAVETDASGNIYIAGISFDTALGRELGFVAKYDPYGSLVWDVALDCNGAATKVGDMVISPTGELYLVSYVPFGWLAKVSSSGSLVFAKALTGFVIPYRVAYDSLTNGVIVVGDSETYGDGMVASGWQASHVYSAYGVYQVTLTVTNNYGVLSSVMKEISVFGALSASVAAPDQSGDPSSVAVSGIGGSMCSLLSPLSVLVVLVLLLLSVTIGDVARTIRVRR